jgi:hypothetical protein
MRLLCVLYLYLAELCGFFSIVIHAVVTGRVICNIYCVVCISMAQILAYITGGVPSHLLPTDKHAVPITSEWSQPHQRWRLKTRDAHSILRLEVESQVSSAGSLSTSS